MKLEEKILFLRKQKGWSQDDLSEKIDVSRQTISKWENGQTQPGLEQLKSLANTFEITIDELVKEDDEESKVEPETVIIEKIVEKKKNKLVKYIVILCILLLYVIFILNRYVILSKIVSGFVRYIDPAEDKMLYMEKGLFDSQRNFTVEERYRIWFCDGYYIKDYIRDDGFSKIEYENKNKNDGCYEVDHTAKTYRIKDNSKHHYLTDLNIKEISYAIEEYDIPLTSWWLGKLRVAIDPNYRIRENPNGYLEISNHSTFTTVVFLKDKLDKEWSVIIKNEEGQDNINIWTREKEENNYIQRTFSLGDARNNEDYNKGFIPPDLNEYTLVEK